MNKCKYINIFFTGIVNKPLLIIMAVFNRFSKKSYVLISFKIRLKSKKDGKISPKYR